MLFLVGALSVPSPFAAVLEHRYPGEALLWREEALHFLEELGIAGGVRWKCRAEIYSRIVTKTPGGCVQDRSISGRSFGRHRDSG